VIGLVYLKWCEMAVLLTLLSEPLNRRRQWRKVRRKKMMVCTENFGSILERFGLQQRFLKLPRERELIGAVLKLLCGESLTILSLQGEYLEGK
jgi:hypothetical protein